MRHTSPASRPISAPRFHRGFAAIALAGTLMLVSGCLYRMDVRQGNFLDDPTQVVRLENGMTKSQVRYLLGTPMLPNGFDSDRWNYYYYEKTRGMKKPATRRVTVYFKDEKVDHFERPADTEAAAAAMNAANEAAMKRNASATDSVPADAPKPPATEPATPR